MTAPDLAAQLVNSLVLNLAVPPDDEYDDPAIPAVERSLAVMLALDIGNVPEEIESAGRRGDREFRKRLMGVLSRAADLISLNPRWREPGDPTPDESRRGTVNDILFTAAAARVAGDWGDEVRVPAAELIKVLVDNNPSEMSARVPALLGLVLDLVDADLSAARPQLRAQSSEPPMMQALERLNRQTALGGATSRLLDAVEQVAEADAIGVCVALVDLAGNERDSERHSSLLWWLLPRLGTIGRRHGDEPRVLNTVLPTLHTYLLAGDPLERGRAIDAWVEIASVHAVPSSLLDLLPVLTQDPTVAVCRAVARATSRLKWPEGELPQLLLHALRLLEGVTPSDQPEAIKDAVNAAMRISVDLPNSVRSRVEKRILNAIKELDGYDLRDALGDRWLPESDRSLEMARLRLRQALDPRINDRWNSRDDDELCALLSCGPGLVNLAEEELRDAAISLAPERAHASAEFAEVAWRSNRPSTAAAIMSAVLAKIPDQPAFRSRRLYIDFVRAAAEVDEDAAAGRDWARSAEYLSTAIYALTAQHDDLDMPLVKSALVAADMRQLLAGGSATEGGDPAEAALRRADALTEAGRALASASTQTTDTGTYLRELAATSEVAAHILRAEAAALEADIPAVTAHAGAASRRAGLILESLGSHFAIDDPLSRPLREVLSAVEGMTPGAPAAPVLLAWSRLCIPLPIVVGKPSRQRAEIVSPPEAEGDQESSTPIALVLTSLDGQLITGPEVLRSGRVYDLGVEVQIEPWPEWADRLDLELLTHLTPTEVTLPDFSWGRADHIGDGATYVKSGSAVLRFNLGPGQPAPPVLVRPIWRGTRDSRPVAQVLDVTGHRELRLRPYDATRDRATDYPVFDERLLAMYDSLARAGYEANELQAFCRLLTSICRVGLRMTWDKKYRRGTRVTEREFHDNLHDLLVADPELGGRVERGSPLALGFLDVRHDGVTTELKVERNTPVTRETAPKYMGQPTQYAAADGARLSILAILDMSPKILPIGTPENYLFTLEPRLHGLDNPEAPSLVAVLVVNGNLPTPSSWFRRRSSESPTVGHLRRQ